MDQQSLTPLKKVGGRMFYKYPYLDIGIATMPAEAIAELWSIWHGRIHEPETAADLLTILVNRGRSASVRTFLYIENPEAALPEEHPLTHAVWRLTRGANIFSTPKAFTYSKQRLYELFKLR